MIRRAQSWSVDLVVAVVIFGLLATIITSVALLNRPDIQELEADAQAVSAQLEQDIALCGPVLNGDAIDSDNLECLYALNSGEYDILKSQLNIEGDFCIFVESADGSVIPITGADLITQEGWGSPNIQVSGSATGTCGF